jgi:hypothetical protein
MTSSDGITWTSQTSAADNFWFDITYGDGLFVAVANSGTNEKVMTSSTEVNRLTIDPIANQTYTGSALTPAIVVKDGGTTLTEGTDYSVAYANNTNSEVCFVVWVTSSTEPCDPILSPIAATPIPEPSGDAGLVDRNPNILKLFLVNNNYYSDECK